jgi:predicted MFS family arabinose efflux permease
VQIVYCWVPAQHIIDADMTMSAEPSRVHSAQQGWIAPFLAVLFAMTTLQMASLGFSPLLPDIQNQFRINYGQVGLFTGVYGLIGILLSYPAGLLARKYGEKPVLLSGLIVVVAGLSILALAPSFLIAFGGRVVWLSGYRLAFVCVMIAVALTAPPKLKGSTMGIVGAMSAFASVVGAPFGSQLGRTFGWRGGIAGYAAFALAGALVFALFYQWDRGADPSSPHGKSTARPASVQRAYKLPAVWIIAGGIGLLNMGGFTITFFVPSVAKGVFHLSSMDAAYMISAAYFVAIFVNLGCGYVADRLDRVKVMIGLGALLVVASLALLSTDLLVFRFAVIALVALGHSATNQSYAMIGAVLKGRETGPAMGIVSLGAGLYAYLGPQMIGLLRDWTGGFVAGFHMLVGVACVGLILMFVLKRSEDRRNAALLAAPAEEAAP